MKKFIALFMVGLAISNLYGCNKKEQNVNEDKLCIGRRNVK